jgi:tol-pal system protein YbgF
MTKTRCLAQVLPVTLALAAAAVLGLGPGSVARAQDYQAGGGPRSQDDPNAKRLDRLEKELREVRQIVLQAHATGQPVEIKEAGPDPLLTALQARLDEGDAGFRRLTGEVETLTHDLALARKDLDDASGRIAALVDRIDKLDKQVAAPPPPPEGAAMTPPEAPAPATIEDPKTAYAHARRLLADGDYSGAAVELQAYIDHFGDTASAPAARYWLGEARFIQKDYAGAAAAYLGAIRGWPKTDWAPEVVVKLAASLVELNKPADACGALGEFDRRYPHAAAALKARAAATRLKAKCAD